MAATDVRHDNFYSGQVPRSPLHHSASFNASRAVSPLQKRGAVPYQELHVVLERDRGKDAAKAPEADWLSGMESSLRREVDELRRRNSSLEAQISVADDSECSRLDFGGLSGLSTAAASGGARDWNSPAISWGRRPPPTEDRFAEERQSLRSRVSKLEDEHRHLEMARMRRLAHIDGRPDSAMPGAAQSSVAVVQQLDGLQEQMRDAEAACQNAERQAIEKEVVLARVRCEVEEWRLLDSPEGRRLAAETRTLREQVQAISAERDASSRRLQEGDETSTRASRSASSFKSDRGILEGTREAILLEEVTVRERLTAISRATLQTNSALLELREAHAGVVRRGKAEVQESTFVAEAAETEVEATNARLSLSDSMLASCSLEISVCRESLEQLHPAHSASRERFAIAREAHLQQKQSKESECDATSADNAEKRPRLSSAVSGLQDMRAAYAARFGELKQTALALTSEHGGTSANCERLRAIISEMYSHADALSQELDGERKRGSELAREVAAVLEAARLAHQQVGRRSRGGRACRENVDSSPEKHAATKAGAASRAGWKRSPARF